MIPAFLLKFKTFLRTEDESIVLIYYLTFDNIFFSHHQIQSITIQDNAK